MQTTEQIIDDKNIVTTIIKQRHIKKKKKVNSSTTLPFSMQAKNSYCQSQTFFFFLRVIYLF